MPKRTSKIKRIASAEMQGDDSFVVIHMPTVEEARNANDQMQALQRAVDNAQRHLSTVMTDANANGTYESAQEKLREAQESLTDFSLALIADYVKEWNWVDDDGNALPQPGEAGSVDMLTMSEYKWLVQQFMGLIDQKK